MVHRKKINLTGAVAVVDDKQVIGRSADNLSKLLQGAVPNMNVTVSNGRPGQGGSINIRGINSISSSATPLILVDGVEGTIDAVNPNDVESISVLKDASSAAVYGARAAYGVIWLQQNLVMMVKHVFLITDVIALLTYSFQRF